MTVFKITKQDTFDMYSVLGKINARALKKFKKAHMKSDWGGCPAMYMQEPEGSSSDAEVQEGIQRFYADIDKAIYAFSAPEPEFLGSFSKGLEHMKALPDGTRKWDMVPDSEEGYRKYLELCKEHNKKVQEGLEAFTRVFPNLWI